jgi:hypothetical protein
MSDNILSHNDMCRREGKNPQRGMNFGHGGNYSVILMSVRLNAPYKDRLEDGGTILIYEGHDMPKSKACPYPKVINHPRTLPSWRLTENGTFFEAAQEFKNGKRTPERVRVCEKFIRAFGLATAYSIS